MDKQSSRTTAGHLRLAAKDGMPVPVPVVPAIDAPEATLVVSFRGLTEEEQQAAMRGFPGGRRFRLQPTRGAR